MTPFASATVRTNGIMILTLVRPISSRTNFSASASMAKHSANSSERYREAPR